MEDSAEEEEVPGVDGREVPRQAMGPPAPASGRRRNQGRQQQRARRRQNFDADRASRLQRLFARYPGRATREIFGEKSARYTGSSEEAKNFLTNTYEAASPPEAQLEAARGLFDECGWALPTADHLQDLDTPPTRAEIRQKLARAKNTAPGEDRLEYIHLRALDPEGVLLEAIFDAVWRLGIPEAWKRSRTVSIHKKGPTDDLSNFRPISLLPTVYKIFSGILCSRITSVASDLAWLSAEQKGFLPGVLGIQEHTQVLQMAVEEAKSARRKLAIAWLDLRNAFGSIPHAILNLLFDSLPLPQTLKSLLRGIYADNIMDFVLPEGPVSVRPSSGVRQGDALSTIVFNLASEPVLRAALQQQGFPMFNVGLRATAYADDIAVLGTSERGLQETLQNINMAANTLGLHFNPTKCSWLLMRGGKAVEGVNISIGGSPISSMGQNDQEDYLGIPIGARLLFRPTGKLIPLVDKLKDSLLAPSQKLEVYRSHLLPSLSHHLASGRVKKEDLNIMDTECRKFLRAICGMATNEHAINDFFYADRRVGGLGTHKLCEDADAWIVSRATQLLTSADPRIKQLCWGQLNDTIDRAFNGDRPVEATASNFLSGETGGGLYRARFANRAGRNIWTLARRSANNQGIRIDVSDGNRITITVDDVSCVPRKAVRGIRTAFRQRATNNLLAAPHQGRVALGHNLDPSKDVTWIVSGRSALSIQDWTGMHRARLDILPLRGYEWSKLPKPEQLCRRCGSAQENGQHLLNGCRVGLVEATKRHDSAANQHLLVEALQKKRLDPTVNTAFPGSTLRPDIALTTNGSVILIDVSVAYDSPECMTEQFRRKISKYSVLQGTTYPLIVGSLGSWLPSNDNIRAVLNIDGRSWGTFRRRARVAALQGSMKMIRNHLAGDQGPEGRGNV